MSTECFLLPAVTNYSVYTSNNLLTINNGSFFIVMKFFIDEQQFFRELFIVNCIYSLQLTPQILKHGNLETANKKRLFYIIYEKYPFCLDTCKSTIPFKSLATFLKKIKKMNKMGIYHSSINKSHTIFKLKATTDDEFDLRLISFRHAQIDLDIFTFPETPLKISKKHHKKKKNKN